MFTTEELIRSVTHKFRARRVEKFVHAGGVGMKVHGGGERTLWLPNGTALKVTTDDSDHVTQIEEGDKLHGIARPDSHRIETNRFHGGRS